jgi:cytochrome c oxidase cbb3-type subunit 3
MTTSDRIRDHDYDGIQEYDNRLPNWWLWTFYLAVIFAFVYWLHYHSIGTGDLPHEQFAAEMAAADARAMELAAQQPATDEMLLAMAQDPAAVSAGRGVYAANCIACHLPTGGGSIGPNLTDAHWIHGSRPTDLLRTVTNGVLEKGMVQWGPLLGPIRCRQVVAYLLTLKNTNVAGGKAPEGKPDAADR